LAELVERMKQQRQPTGATESIGPVLVEWVSHFLAIKQSLCLYNWWN